MAGPRPHAGYVITGLACTLVWALPRHAGRPVGRGSTITWSSDQATPSPGPCPSPIMAHEVFIHCFAVCVVVAAVNLSATGVVWFAGGHSSSRHWVAFGAALTTALYAEKALGRFDDGHLLQVVTVACRCWRSGWLCPDRRWTTRSGRSSVARPTPRRSPGRQEGRPRRVSPRPGNRCRWSDGLLLVALPSVHQAATTRPTTTRSTSAVTSVAGLGWTADDAVDRRCCATCAPWSTPTPGRPVFDFTNSPGYFYYLLGRTRRRRTSTSAWRSRIHAEIVIDQLEKSRPELVVFDAPFGLPGWDGPHNEVRHYTLSQYLLDGWTPVVRTNHVLFLIRNDILETARAARAEARGPELNRLWFAAPVCDFGYTANFLSLGADRREADPRGRPSRPTRRIGFRGWAYDTANHRPVRHVVVVGRGRRHGLGRLDPHPTRRGRDPR